MAEPNVDINRSERLFPQTNDTLTKKMTNKVAQSNNGRRGGTLESRLDYAVSSIYIQRLSQR